jgi:cytoskeletal protein CcmA (bactofilin family)
MPDLNIKPGETATLDRVEGELRVGSRARIRAANGRSVVVSRGVYFEGSVEVDCDFSCESMKLEGRGYGSGGNIIVTGNLTVQGAADIDASLEVGGDLKAERTEVGGHLKAKNVSSRLVRVGGHMVAKGTLEAEGVDVGGHLTVTEGVKLGSLRVGGHVKIGGGVISGKIQVRGHLETTSKLEFGELELFGHVRLPAGSKGNVLIAFGRAEFLGDAYCRAMQARGTVKVAGDYSGESAEVSGKLEVLGSLNATKKLEIGGVAEVGQQVKCESISVFGRLEADSALVTEAEIDGEVKISRYLKGRSILVGRGSTIAGSIVGEQVEIGKTQNSLAHWAGELARIGRMTEVQDVYGIVVRIGPYSRARRIFAESVEMDNGSIADQVVYTKDLKLPSSCYLGKPPIKMTTLPEFPG